MGIPTTDDRRLDADMILCAPSAVLAADALDVVVATENVKHLSRFADALEWREIFAR